MTEKTPKPHGCDVWAMGVAGALLLRALRLTFRVRRLGEEHTRPFLEQGGSFLLTFWHGHLLHLACLMSHMHPHTLVSEHRDGEIISQILERLGCGTVRGSTTRGGYRALLEMVRRGRAGVPLGITPDGPRGPRHEVQPGALIVAQRAGIPMIPLAAYAHPEKRLDSWDRFQIPFPFAKLVVVTGPPLWVPAELDPQEAIRQYSPRLADALGSVSRTASDELARWSGADRGWHD